VSIRQKAKLGRFQKLWTSKCIAIEDPFDLNHNLGSGLSRKSTFWLSFFLMFLIFICLTVNNFIIKTFRKGRMHFGTPITREELSLRTPVSLRVSKKIIAKIVDAPGKERI
jgi:terminal uridylyltransferase